MTTPPVPLLSVARSLEPILSSTEQPGPAAASDSSWLTDKWDKFAYDERRGLEIGSIARFFTHKHLRAPYDVAKELKVSVQALRAAEIIATVWAFRNEVASGSLSPEAIKDGQLCMESCKYMFHACRYPDRVRDSTASFVGPEAVESVIVACKYYFFELPMRHPDGSRDLSVAELATQLQIILDNAQKLVSAPGYGVLTTTDRDTWFANRQRLIALNPELHTRLLHRIEASAFLVALDDAELWRHQDWPASYWHRVAPKHANCWFDKSLQFTVFEDGGSGFFGERSQVDGMVTLRLNKLICSRVERKDSAVIGSVDTSLPAPTTLDFAAPDAYLSASLKLARRQFMFLVASQIFSVVDIPGIGSKRIEALRASPDAFAQLVIQLASYHRSDLDRVAYEAYQTRNFAFGFIETCSELPSEVVAFCLSMMRVVRPETLPESETLPDGNTLAGLARTAMARQSECMKLEAKPMAINRRLLELRMLHANKDSPLPIVCTGYANTDFEGWSGSQLEESFKEKFEIAYIVQENTLCFHVRSHGCTSTKEMAESLDCSANVLADLLGADVVVNRRASTGMGHSN